MAGLDFTLLAPIAVVALLAASAFFSSAEIAIFSLGPDWLAERVAAGDERASVLSDLQDDPHRLLVTLLVGNNLVNVAISSVVTAVLVTHFPPGLAVTVATLVAASAVLIFGEIVPKSYGLGHAESWALRVAHPVKLIERLLYPIVAAFDLVTRGIGTAIGGDRDIEEPYTDDG